jgi:predicted methyltransferase
MDNKNPNMVYVSLVEQAHQILSGVIQPGDVVIDATVGNGYDTVFLANAVGDSGTVLGFDVQEQALQNTRRILQQNGLQNRVCLWLQSHANAADFIPQAMRQGIKAVMFNLGYLPGSDKSVTTLWPATLMALNGVLPQLANGGIISVMAYRGHEGGAEEAQAVLNWGAGLDSRLYTVELLKTSASSEKSPLLAIITKTFQSEH